MATARATPNDLAAVARTLSALPSVKETLAGRPAGLLAELECRVDPCPDLTELLDKALCEEPPHSSKEGGIIC